VVQLIESNSNIVFQNDGWINPVDDLVETLPEKAEKLQGGEGPTHRAALGPLFDGGSGGTGIWSNW